MYRKNIGFWSFVSLLFLISTLGLTTYVTSNAAFIESLITSAYSPGSTNIVDMNHYIQKFGFYSPTATYGINSADFSRLTSMMRYVFIGTDKYNQRFGETVEPELIVWWSYAEGIGGRVTFSNCHDAIYSISNCSTPWNWQLGYGIQFTAVADLLVKAFADTHGDPNNSQLVQSVGQNVLNIDRGNGANCGCSFPQMTVGQIVSGISYSHATQNNFWASVLSRDPSINSYINAEALRISRFNRQIAFGWGSYYRTHWQEYSNDLATILSKWVALGGCNAGTNCYISNPTNTPVPVLTLIYSPTPTITSTPTPKPSVTLTPAPKPTVTPTPTPIRTITVVVTATPSPTPNTVTVVVTATPTPTSIPTELPTATEVPTTTEEPSPTPANIASGTLPSSTSGTTLPEVTFAPIVGISQENQVSPTPTPPTMVAGSTTSNVIGLFSVLGIVFSLLLAIPNTRRKLLALYKKFVLHDESAFQHPLQQPNTPEGEKQKEV